MTNVNRALVLYLGLFFVSASFAQGCPSGIPAGAPGCVPPDIYNSQFNKQPKAVLIKRKWADRWGAVASDSIRGVLGTSTGLKNKQLAINSAIKDCKKKGGNNCEIEITYYNQCAGMFTSNTEYFLINAPSLEKVKEIGMGKCEKEGQVCKIYYSNCSMAEIETE